VLLSIARDLNRPALSTQSPEQGGGCRCLPNLPDSSWFSRYQLMPAPAATFCRNRTDSSSQIRWRVPGLCSPWPLGSRQLPRHATTAFFFAFFPPRSQSRSPCRRMSVSGTNGPKIYCAIPSSSLRSIPSPALLIPNCGWLPPEFSSGFSRVNT
jgi:hypothetical protein